MAYAFRLNIEKEKSALSLMKDGAVAASKEWPEERDMGRRLFEAIAELLEENGLKPEQASDFMVTGDMPDNFTSMRIAETVKKVYTFAVKSEKD